MRLSCGIDLVRLFAIVSALPQFAAAQSTGTQLKATREGSISAETANLSVVRNVLLSRDGGLVVPQPQDQSLRIFTASGKAGGSFGRKGEGPGEFRDVGLVGWLGDSLWVSDLQSSRVTILSPQLQFARSIAIPPSITVDGMDPAYRIVPGAPRAVYGDGSILFSARLRDPRPVPSWASGAQGATDQPLLRITPDGKKPRVIAWVPKKSCSVPLPEGGNLGIPFCLDPPYAVSGDGSRLALTDYEVMTSASRNFKVTVLSSTGDTIFSRRIEAPLVAIPRKVLDSVVEFRAGTMPPTMAAAQRSMRLPTYFPPVKRIVAGADGSTWIELWAGTSGARWVVLDPKGTEVGRLDLPTGVVLAAEQKAAWILESDADGAQTLVRVAIRH